MELTDEVKNKLMNFKFRYAEKIEGKIYKIYRVKDYFNNPSNPQIIGNDKMCFWTDDCADHRCCINFKNILFF